MCHFDIYTRRIDSKICKRDERRLRDADAYFKSDLKLTGDSACFKLRAEREALSLIHSLRSQGQSPIECLAAIAADQTLTEPVRQRALQFAREWKP